MQQRTTVRIGGISFIAGALAFVAVFSYLAASFNYPAVLDGSAAEVLPRLRGGGDTMRAAWALYAFLPLLLIPGAMGAQAALPGSPGRMRLALIAMVLGAFAMCLGLMRWPSMHWALAEAWPQAGPDAQASLAALFRGLNLYLGNYIGEFLGEFCLALFFCLTGLAMKDEARFAKWLAWGGIVFGLLFLIGAFRNVTHAVQGVADANNSLLPLWMIVLGVCLIRHARTAPN